jgi:hypothetical protein
MIAYNQFIVIGHGQVAMQNCFQHFGRNFTATAGAMRVLRKFNKG